MSYLLALERLKQRAWQPIELEQPVPVEELPTPALVLEGAVLKRNLMRMQAFQDAHGKGIRPHAKTHKTPIIAHLQIEQGAVGVCAAKVSEAAVLVLAGVEDVLVTSPVVSPQKIRILAELAERSAALKVVIDSLTGLQALADGLPDGVEIGVLVDVDVNMGRTGLRGAEAITELARAACDQPAIRFEGIQHYAGHIMHIAPHADRREKSLATWAAMDPVLESLARVSIDCPIVTGGGTGTYDIDCDVTSVTDLQVGSYTVMDREYQEIGAASGAELFDDFEVALTVAATAISAPVPGKAITVDGGYKVFASDTVTPRTDELAGSEFFFGGDEHGILRLAKGTQQPALGDVYRFVTPHCDPTVNLHEFYWVLDEDGLVKEAWPVAARGCSW